MSGFSDWVVPCFICGVFMLGLLRGLPVFDLFLEGAKEGLRTTAAIAAPLICLLTAVAMFRASGALQLLTAFLAPLAKLLGVPPEVLPLGMLRPVSGSGATAVFTDILGECGPDSFPGRVASVMMGSTETTFYTVAVYYGAVGVKNARHTLAASLSADLVGMVMSAVAVRLLL